MLNAPDTKTSTRILGTGSALPGRDLPGAVMTNARLTDLMAEARTQLRSRGHAARFELSTPEFPEERIGIQRRRILDERLTVRDMAVEAARHALARSGIDRERIRAVVVSTVSQDSLLPSVATTVQARLALPQEAAAFDVTLGCTGFVAALDVASRMLAGAPQGSCALIVATETMLRVLDACDRTTCPIFGDAAAAVVVERSGPSEVVWKTLGELGLRIEIKAPLESSAPVMRFRCRDDRLFVSEDVRCRRSARMDGNRVYREMARLVPESIADYLEARDMTIDDVDLFVFHQANRRMIESFARDRRLRLPDAKVPCNIADVGNTSSASIPLLLDELRERGELPPDSRVLLIGFGSGYSLAITQVSLS